MRRICGGHRLRRQNSIHVHMAEDNRPSPIAVIRDAVRTPPIARVQQSTCKNDTTSSPYL